jgi:hypothetical protein
MTGGDKDPKMNSINIDYQLSKRKLWLRHVNKIRVFMYECNHY